MKAILIHQTRLRMNNLLNEYRDELAVYTQHHLVC